MTPKKTSRRSSGSTPAARRKAPTREMCEQALRACELEAVRLRAAGGELAESWAGLCREIATGVSSTDALRKRAWCNVLELRLKEQAQALERARHAVDAVWNDLMLTVRARELVNRFLKRDAAETAAGAGHLPLLVRTASAIAAAHRPAAAAKR